MTNLLAAGTPIGNFDGIGPLSNIGTTPTDAINKFVSTISTIIGILTILGAIWFIVQLIIGALGWISSGSDKQNLENAKKKIMNAMIGLLLVIFAYALIGLIGFVMGIDIINLNTLIDSLQP